MADIRDSFWRGAPEALLVVDTKGCVVDCNDAAQALVGAESELVGVAVDASIADAPPRSIPQADRPTDCEKSRRFIGCSLPNGLFAPAFDAQNCALDSWTFSPDLISGFSVFPLYRTMQSAPARLCIVAETSSLFFQLMSTSNPPRAQIPLTAPSLQDFGRAGRRSMMGRPF